MKIFDNFELNDIPIYITDNDSLKAYLSLGKQIKHKK